MVKNLKKEKIAIISGVICLVLAFAISIQIKTINNMSRDIGGTSLNGNSDLQDQYLKWKSMNDQVSKDLDTAEQKLEKIRNDAASNNANDASVEEEITKNNSSLGLTDVTGDGVTIVLDDNRNVSISDVNDISKYLIHQEDILEIVNELFNAGADAISINGQRIVNTTAIFCDGNIIRINNEKVGVPITIQAIGYTERLYYAINRTGGYIDYIKSDGANVDVYKSQNLRIPKYTGVYSYQWIK